MLKGIGLGDGTCMCSFHFPNIFEEWEKDVDPDYFESGVRFTMTIDNWAQVISDQEFVWLIRIRVRCILPVILMMQLKYMNY